MKATYIMPVLLVALSGCGSVYTSIAKNTDGTYLVTRNKQGFGMVSGTLLSCTAQSEVKLTCVEVGSP